MTALREAWRAFLAAKKLPPGTDRLKRIDAAEKVLEAAYCADPTITDRERACVDAGQASACCCCNGVSAAEAYCREIRDERALRDLVRDPAQHPLVTQWLPGTPLPRPAGANRMVSIGWDVNGHLPNPTVTIWEGSLGERRFSAPTIIEAMDAAVRYLREEYSGAFATGLVPEPVP